VIQGDAQTAPAPGVAASPRADGRPYDVVTTCRCCGGGDLVCYLDLGAQPLANAFHAGAAPQPRFPLAVNFCRQCHHSQLSIAVRPDLVFGDYPYMTGVSQTMKQHLRALATDAVSAIEAARAAVPGAPRTPARPIRVLEIAANDGTLLEQFRDCGCEVAGVDPAENLRPITYAKGLDVRVAYWGGVVPDDLCRRFDLVVACNVLAHVLDQVAFLTACAAALGEGGRVIVEVPYARVLVERGEFDTIYHEHNSYFLVDAFRRLAARAGFRIAGVLQTPIHGGSLRFTLRPGHGPHCRDVEALVDEEQACGLFAVETYRRFGARVHQQVLPRLAATIADLQANGFKLIGYGASAKSTVLLNALDVAARPGYLVDETPLKIGRRAPGTDLPIRPATAIQEESPAQPLAFMILSWNFLSEIRAKIRALRGGSAPDVYVCHVPEIVVRPLGVDGPDPM
jgi:SAM-dependent methyltransferase